MRTGLLLFKANEQYLQVYLKCTVCSNVYLVSLLLVHIYLFSPHFMQCALTLVVGGAVLMTFDLFRRPSSIDAASGCYRRSLNSYNY